MSNESYPNDQDKNTISKLPVNSPEGKNEETSLEMKRFMQNLDQKSDQDFDLMNGLDEAFYQGLHDRIMASVEKTEVKKRNQALIKLEKAHRKLKENWRRIVYSGTVTMAACAVGVQAFYGAKLLHSYWERERLKQDATLVSLAQNQDEFNRTIVGQGGGGDFFVDVSRQSAENLSQEMISQFSREIISQ